MKDFKIVDCFTFYNELNILKLRLSELYDFVDYFILCEAPLTHRGNKKKLFYQENKKLFQQFESKIIHLIDDEIPKLVSDPWVRENHQRNFILNGLKKLDLNDNDQILISDVDEIPNVHTLKNLLPLNWVYSLEQQLYYYNFHNLHKRKWRAAKVLDFKTFNDIFNSSPQQVRVVKDSLNIFNININRNLIKKGGWHLSYFGDPNMIINKIENFAHYENDIEEFKQIDYIKKSIKEGLDIHNKGYKIKKIKFLNPKNLPNNYKLLLND